MKNASCLAKVAPNGFAGAGKKRGGEKKKITTPPLCFFSSFAPAPPPDRRGSPGGSSPPPAPAPHVSRGLAAPRQRQFVANDAPSQPLSLSLGHAHTDYRHRRTYMAMEELLPCSLNSMQSMHLHIYNVCVYFPPLQWQLQWDQASRVHISFYLFICGSACENPAWKKKIYPMQACLPASLFLPLSLPCSLQTLPGCQTH